MANMELITSVTVGAGGAASVTLPATGTIPQTYTDLKIVCSPRHSAADVSNDVLISLNGSTSNFTGVRVYGTGSVGGRDTATRTVGTSVGSSATANTFGNNEIYILNYASANFKTISTDQVGENNATQAFQILGTNLWSDTAAITTITLSAAAGSFVEHSTFYLYGISNVTSGSKATGGVVSSDGTYWYHTFPFSGTFTPTQSLTADYLVIAGGGGGGSLGGGGGAGGVRSTVGATGGGGSLESALSLTANTAYTVTVGAGGASGSSGGAGVEGGNSVFSTITSTGGGRGAGDGVSATTGGSGGGGGNSPTSAGAAATASPVQGFAGGGYGGGGGSGSGGGGAGAAGGPGAVMSTQVAAGGNGGIGVLISAFANATQTGVNTYYAGGGGGGGRKDSVGGDALGGTGGTGGGGRGGSTSDSTPSTAGTANTGGGGGGGGYGNAYRSGSAGGSGLVIIRYAI